MNFVKKNLKWIITIIGVIIVTTGISVYATGQYLASQVDYNKNGQAKVSDALDDLYSKVPSGTENITSNGTYNIANKESVNVNVTTPVGTKTLLWTNSNSNSAFANDTITLSSSIANYTHFLLIYKADKGSAQQYEDIFKIFPERTQNGLAGNYVFGATINNGHYSRNIWYVSSTSLKFGNANQMSNNNTVNDYLIPLYIYGLSFSY